MNNH
jgi:hypothetical protein